MSNLNPQAEQAREQARKSNGEFGSYSAGESGASLDVVPDEVTLPSGVTVSVDENGYAESDSPGTAERNLFNDSRNQFHDQPIEFIGSDDLAFATADSRAREAAERGNYAVVHAIDKKILSGGDAEEDVPTGSEVGYQEFTPEEWASKQSGKSFYDGIESDGSYDQGDNNGEADHRGITTREYNEFESPDSHMIDVTTGEIELDNFYVYEPSTDDPHDPGGLRVNDELGGFASKEDAAKSIEAESTTGWGAENLTPVAGGDSEFTYDDGRDVFEFEATVEEYQEDEYEDLGHDPSADGPRFHTTWSVSNESNPLKVENFNTLHEARAGLDSLRE